MEGKDAGFTANPLSGWKFAGWSGASAAGINADKSPVTIKAMGDIERAASFVGDGTNKFQAEEGVIENAINESSNAGFAGTGYINFGTGTSSVKVPVYADAAGEYKLTMTYANGSSAARSLSIKGEAGGAQEVEFATTANWTTYETKEISVKLAKGASYITFSIVGGNDGPNLDQLELTAVNVEKSDTGTTAIYWEFAGGVFAAGTGARTMLFNVNGMLIRQAVGTRISTEGLPGGVYVEKTVAPGMNRQRIIRVR